MPSSRKYQRSKHNPGNASAIAAASLKEKTLDKQIKENEKLPPSSEVKETKPPSSEAKGIKPPPSAVTDSTNKSDLSDDASEGSSRELTAYIVGTKSQSTSVDKDFVEVMTKTNDAITSNVHPELIPSGSSGSYFVYDVDHRAIGVFKPKDEEPFAPLNPKWAKYFQRMLCFCCFGRACLIPNHGYLSETAASLFDDRFKLGIVPKTRVVSLKSSNFFYGSGCMRKNEIKPKTGSFQLFVHGYNSATEMWPVIEAKFDQLPENEKQEILVQFQKLCFLDYAIRNTDRHLDNWLIRYVEGEPVKIAAIDNGLAFPVKHPECASRFRKFRFHWAELSIAKHPVDPALREQWLALLTPAFVHALTADVYVLFRHDKTHNSLLTKNQLRVFRGQLYNLRCALAANDTPSDWVGREPLVASRRYLRAPSTDAEWEQWCKFKLADYSNPVCC